MGLSNLLHVAFRLHKTPSEVADMSVIEYELCLAFMKRERRG